MTYDSFEGRPAPVLSRALQTPTARVQRSVMYITQVGAAKLKAWAPEAQWVTTADFINSTITQVAADADTVHGVAIKSQNNVWELIFDAADATHAINAAIRLQYQIKRANENRSIESFCSVGIATGWVFTYTASTGAVDHLGSVVDRAAQLCDAANANAIFIDHDTNAAANTTLIESPLGKELGRTAREYLGEVQRTPVKGFDQPLEWFEILWDKQRFSLEPETEPVRSVNAQPVPAQVAPAPSAAPRTGRQDRRVGEVKIWLEDGGFGFVRDPQSGEEFHFRPRALVDEDDLDRVKVAGTKVAFTAKEPNGHKHGQATAILVVDEYYEGNLLPTQGKPFGWVIVQDSEGNRQHVYASNPSEHRPGTTLSFRAAVNDRGVYADDIAAAEDGTIV